MSDEYPEGPDLPEPKVLRVEETTRYKDGEPTDSRAEVSVRTWPVGWDEYITATVYFDIDRNTGLAVLDRIEGLGVASIRAEVLAAVVVPARLALVSLDSVTRVSTFGRANDEYRCAVNMAPK